MGFPMRSAMRSFVAAPVTLDMILEALENGRTMHNPLTANV